MGLIPSGDYPLINQYPTERLKLQHILLFIPAFIGIETRYVIVDFRYNWSPFKFVKDDAYGLSGGDLSNFKIVLNVTVAKGIWRSHFENIFYKKNN